MSFIKNHWHWTLLTFGLIIFLGFLVSTQLNTPKIAKNGDNEVPRGIRDVADDVPARQGRIAGSDKLDPWEIWVHNQSHIIATLSEKNSDGDWTYDESYQDSVARLTALAAELKKIQDEPPPLDSNPKVEFGIIPPKKYEGPQTVAGIVKEFDNLISQYAARHDDEAAYPAEAWIQRILDSGATITTRSDLTGYFNGRGFLFSASRDPEFMERLANSHGYPTDTWEAFEEAYIEHMIWRHQTTEAADTNPTIDGGMIIGYNFYPIYANKKTLYVKRRTTGAMTFGDDISNEGLFNLIFRGINPEGFEVVYLDSEWDPLPEKPPPITREEFINASFDRWLTSTEHKESDWVPPMLQLQEEFDSLFETSEDTEPDLRNARAEAAANAAKAEFEQVRKEAERLATLADAELEAEFERMLSATLLQELALEHSNTDLRRSFTPERLAEALSLLNQHGPEAGLQRLQQTNPAMAAFLSQHTSRPNPPPRQGPPPRPGRD